MPREGEKEEGRGLQAGKEEEQEKHDSQHRVQGKARQDLDEGDADGSKIDNE